MDYLIGIDLGTQGTKTVIYDRTGKPVADGFEASRLIYGEGGRVEQDPGEMLGSCLRTIHSAMQAAGIAPADVAALTLDGQMAGIMGIGADGEAVTPYDSWLDQRCAKYFDMLRGFGEERYIGIGGNAVTYSHGPKILWWKHEYPDVFGRVAKFVPPAVYCVMRLCGLDAGQAFIDHTYLHFASFASVEKKEWSAELLGAFDIPEDKFPRIVKPWAAAGRLKRDMAVACGLAEGTVVAAGCGDTAANAFGAGVVKPGMMYDVGGTASTLAVAVDQYVPDTRGKMLKFAASVVDGLYMPLAYMNGAGMCLPWFKDEILGIGEPKYSYGQMDDMAAGIAPGSNGLLFIPHFSGRVCPGNTNLRGAWLNLNWDHTAAHMYRSVMESIAYEYKIYLNRITGLVPGQEYERIIAVGGAARSPLFRQIKADVLGLAEWTLARDETATLGAAVIGGRAAGLFDDLAQTVEDMNEFVDGAVPDMAAHRVYEPYARAYEMSLEEMDRCYARLRDVPGA
jgi:xylulokinase